MKHPSSENHHGNHQSSENHHGKHHQHVHDTTYDSYVIRESSFESMPYINVNATPPHPYLHSTSNSFEARMPKPQKKKKVQVVHNDDYGEPHYAKNGGYGAPDYAKNGGYGEPDYAKNGDYGEPDYARNGGYGEPDYAKNGGYGEPDYARNGGYGEPDYAKNGGYGEPDYAKNGNRQVNQKDVDNEAEQFIKLEHKKFGVSKWLSMRVG